MGRHAHRSARFRAGVATLAGVALAGTVAGCGASSTTSSSSGASPAVPSATAAHGTVTVFAAASLATAFRRIGQRFEAANPGAKVTFNFGGSDTLARQITQGAPADVFASANQTTMGQVTQAHDAADAPRPFVRNVLEIAVAGGNPRHIAGLADLTKPGVQVALCAATVPCGSAAASVLRTSRLTLTPATLEQDVTGALTKVELGEVDAALVYQTDVKAAAGKVTGVQFPEADSAVNTYPITTLSAAPNPSGARAFAAYVLSPAGRAILTDAGFRAP